MKTALASFALQLIGGTLILGAAVYATGCNSTGNSAASSCKVGYTYNGSYCVQTAAASLPYGRCMPGMTWNGASCMPGMVPGVVTPYAANPYACQNQPRNLYWNGSACVRGNLRTDYCHLLLDGTPTATGCSTSVTMTQEEFRSRCKNKGGVYDEKFDVCKITKTWKHLFTRKTAVNTVDLLTEDQPTGGQDTGIPLLRNDTVTVTRAVGGWSTDSRTCSGPAEVDVNGSAHHHPKPAVNTHDSVRQASGDSDADADASDDSTLSNAPPAGGTDPSPAETPGDEPIDLGGSNGMHIQGLVASDGTEIYDIGSGTSITVKNQGTLHFGFNIPTSADATCDRIDIRALSITRCINRDASSTVCP